MEEEIRVEFTSSGFTLDEEDEVLKKCLTFCINYQLQPSDLVSSWEVYYLNRQLDEPIVRNAEMDGFLQHLQNEKKEAVIEGEPDLHVYSSKDVEMILDGEDEKIKEVIPGTPNGQCQNSSPEPYETPQTNGRPSERATPFGLRSDKFVIKFCINGMSDVGMLVNGDDDVHDEDVVIRKVKEPERCSVIVHVSGPESGCRFMFDRIEDRFNALENRIKEHVDALAASGQYEEPVDPTIASQKSMFTVGMICCDGEGRLNDKSILLQSSTQYSVGQRVRLELQKLSQFSIFPGQIVGIEGYNPSGHCLIASKLVDYIPFPATADESLHQAKKPVLDPEIQPNDLSFTRKELSMIIASGPFTTSDNLLFEPLSELLAYAKRKLPQLLVLLGPFIDSDHPDFKRGAVDRSFDEMFNSEVVAKLRDYVECVGSGSRVLLMPSPRDANHDFVFPQPAFDIQPSHLRYQVTSVTNPSMFEANQVRIGCCTVDILRHLSGEEMSRQPKNGAANDRMTRLANHILRQRSFYPLYPPAEGLPFDFSLAPESLRISLIPDILILPSDMKHFVKVLSVGESGEEERVKSVCVNPGRLAKGEGGGTFAEINYFGSPDKMNASIISI